MGTQYLYFCYRRFKDTVESFFEILWLVNWIRDDLEGVALLLEPLDALGKGSAQLVDGLERVVESDDGAIAGVAPRSVGFAIRPH